MEIQQYYFLVYFSNPMRQNVTVFVDGSQTKIVFPHKNFLELISSTMGYSLYSAVAETLNTYGTFWLLDRENCTVTQLAISAGQDILVLQNELQKTRDALAAEQQGHAAIDPAEKYAKSAISIPAMDNISTPFDTSRTQKKSIFGITIPFRK